jgi:GNAT superfamily N-acetyltransferase
MGEVGVIENLYVSETFRRQGFGRAMMSRVIELASRAQWRHVLMAVPEKSDGLLELSTQWGFKKIADWPEYHPAAASYAAPIILP